MYNIFIQGGN